METTKVSTKGQVVLPKSVRDAQKWETGQELAVIAMGDCVILRKAPKKAGAGWGSIAGMLSRYRKDKPVTDEEMHEAVSKAAAKSWRKSTGE